MNLCPTCGQRMPPRDGEKRAARKAFALAAAERMRAAGVDPLEYSTSFDFWKQEAKAAKAAGLYSPKTYFADAASSLRSMVRFSTGSHQDWGRA